MSEYRDCFLMCMSLQGEDQWCKCRASLIQALTVERGLAGGFVVGDGGERSPGDRPWVVTGGKKLPTDSSSRKSQGAEDSRFRTVQGGTTIKTGSNKVFEHEPTPLGRRATERRAQAAGGV